MAVTATTPIELVEEVYGRLAERVALGRERLGRPLTLAEKILRQPPPRPREPGARAGPQLHRLRPRPRRHAGRHRPDGAAPVHDRRPARGGGALHRPLRPPHPGQGRRRHRPASSPSTPTARSTSSSARCRPSTASASGSRAAGIIHQVVLENYAFPGGMMIGTDSHTPNAGGLGMVAIGVGGADAVDVMTGFPFNVRWPKLIGVHLTGELSGWSTPEGRHPQGRRDPHREGRHRRHRRVLRPRRRLASRATGKATICNMGAEIGATTSLFAYDANMAALPASHRARGDRRRRRRGRRATSGPTTRCSADPGAYFDQVIEIDLDQLEPHDQRPPHPRPRPPASPSVGADAKAEGWPLEISLGAHRLVHELAPTRTSPGPRRSPARRRPRACGRRPSCSSPPAPSRCGPPSSATACSPTSRPSAAPCWPTPAARASASGTAPTSTTSKLNTIVNCYNRNFPKRNDGNANTLAFVTSPDTVIALALAGTLDFDPRTDTLTNDAGEEVRLDPPVGEELPEPGLRPRRGRLPGPARRRQRRRGRSSTRQRPAPAARAVRRRGTARTTSSCPCC